MLVSVSACRMVNSALGTASTTLAFMRLCAIDSGHYRHSGDISRNPPWYVTLRTRELVNMTEALQVYGRVLSIQYSRILNENHPDDGIHSSSAASSPTRVAGTLSHMARVRMYIISATFPLADRYKHRFLGLG